LKRFSSRIDVFLNEFDVSVRDRTYAKKVSRIISELKDDTSGFDDNFKDNNFENNDSKNDDSKNDDSKNDDVEDDNVRNNNIEDNKTRDAKKNKILNYIFQSSNKKAVAKFLVNITSPKFAQICFRNLVRCITQTHDKRVIHNVLIRLLCVRLRGRSNHRFRCNQLKKIKLK